MVVHLPQSSITLYTLTLFSYQECNDSIPLIYWHCFWYSMQTAALQTQCGGHRTFQGWRVQSFKKVCLDCWHLTVLWPSVTWRHSLRLHPPKDKVRTWHSCQLPSTSSRCSPLFLSRARQTQCHLAQLQYSPAFVWWGQAPGRTSVRGWSWYVTTVYPPDVCASHTCRWNWFSTELIFPK